MYYKFLIFYNFRFSSEMWECWFDKYSCSWHLVWRDWIIFGTKWNSIYFSCNKSKDFSHNTVSSIQDYLLKVLYLFWKQVFRRFFNGSFFQRGHIVFIVLLFFTFFLSNILSSPVLYKDLGLVTYRNNRGLYSVCSNLMFYLQLPLFSKWGFSIYFRTQTGKFPLFG